MTSTCLGLANPVNWPDGGGRPHLRPTVSAPGAQASGAWVRAPRSDLV